MMKDEQAAAGTATSKSGGSGDGQMRKIIMMVGIAILVFLGVTTFSVQKSFQSSDQLTAIKDLYFPVLQKIESNMVRLDKMEELFMRSVMLGDNEPLEEELGFYQQADKAFEEMLAIYPEQSKEITRLRGELKQYQELAHATAVALNNKDTNIDARKMNDLLNGLRESIKKFREASYGNFVKTLADSQATVKLNLYMGIALGLMNLGFMAVLVFFIRNNIQMMAVIAEQNATLELRVAERTAQLRQKTNDIQAMLENMPQGVLTVLPGGVIHPEYSAYMETIFETKDIAGKNMMELVFSNTTLGSDALSTVEVAVGSVIGEDAMNYEFNSHLLVSECELFTGSGAKKSLEFSWSPIADEAGNVEKLMLCVRDVTDRAALAAEAAGLGGGGGGGAVVGHVPARHVEAESRQAQAGALAAQMLAAGATADGSSSVPRRTTVKPGRPEESENSCVPHCGQKRRVTRLPLSAAWVCWASVPVISMAARGKTTFAVPLAAMRWQSRHQQMRAGPAGAETR